ncbi:MAG TPA: tRNA glutamyl-Q(34) synthetase GluQRS [Rhabdaerophilum sp.]|nr:tRNA glutamyl-Q(34) synthetase GluQRS [Rhabdaerophilum sp.]
MQPVFRFAPSPNGFLHLGHAYSALLNAHLARETGGRFLVRIEDIDTVRCTEALIGACLEDLAWLGLGWETPVLRQSTQFGRYRATADVLAARGLLYPCFCSRNDIAAAAGQMAARDPDGAPVYPGTCRVLDAAKRAVRRASGEPFALRLDMAAALAHIGARRFGWQEVSGERLEAVTDIETHPEKWGDVVLVRKETPTSYHLAVVLDDALQGITHVVRGTDLYEATAIHRVLQMLLGLPEPRYHHHSLIRDAEGRKLAKSLASTPLRQLRAEGVTAAQIRSRLGFD